MPVVITSTALKVVKVAQVVALAGSGGITPAEVTAAIAAHDQNPTRHASSTSGRDFATRYNTGVS